jgi:hypothetical protein
MLRRAALEQQLGSFEQQFGDSPLVPLLRGIAGGGGLVVTLVFTLAASIIGFLLFVGVIYLLGRAFGGTGTYGEMAYNTALYSAPLTVISALLAIIPIIGPLAGLLLVFYQLYLYWLSIQAGMNLPGNKALWVILIPVLVVVLLCCVAFIGIIGFITIVSRQTSP